MGPREGKAGFRYTYFAALLGSLTPDHLVLSDTLTQKQGEVPPTRQAEPGSQKTGAETGSQRVCQYSGNNMEENAMIWLFLAGKY